jgi:hypothetical protein
MMLKTISAAAALAAVLAATSAYAADLMKAPPGEPYKKVSELVKLPDFIPGMGQLYVDPATLPAGPFLAYDKDGKLVSTTYMIPMEDLTAQKSFDDLKVAGTPDHVSVYYNAGHPGVEKPHYHVVLWTVSKDEAEKLK